MHLGKPTKFPFNKCQIKCNKVGSRGELHHLNTWFSPLQSPFSADECIRIRHKPFPLESSNQREYLLNEGW